MPIDFLYAKFILWVLVGGLLISTLSTRKHIEVLGNKRERWSLPAAILFVLPLIYWCATRDRGYGDTWAYYQDFLNAPSTLSGVVSFAKSYPKDHWFFGLLAAGKSLFGSNEDFTFGLIAIIQLFSLGLIYRKYSRNFWLSIFLFVASTDYTAWMFNGMRQFLAAAICFTALPFIVQKRYIPAILLVLLGSRFHQSALILLPAIFIVQGKAWNARTLLIALGAVLAIAFVDEFTGFLDSALQDTQYKNVVTDWKDSADDGTNLFRVSVYAVPTLLALVFKGKLHDTDNLLIHICVNMSVISTGVYLISMFTSGILIGRLPIYFSLYNYILLPWELRHFFKKESQFAVTACAVAFYFAFYIYSYM
ncbi:MAG: EpsG family protein [Oscillospiraceae bacterium]|nr:EpsG family protein [Oscillospiraceae bacterium]